MKMKGLVLGAAAGALAVTGAQAADLPVAPEPIDYVRVCDAFGPGYFFIPGTDTCLRVSGRVRADYNYYEFNQGFAELDGSNFGTFSRRSDAYRFRARAYFRLDSRTNTEFGLLRTYQELQITSNAGNDNGRNGVDIDSAFIQFGGLTFGRAKSFFDFAPANFTPAQTFNPAYSSQQTNLLAYTFAFGNGFSASLSLEDEEGRRTGIVDAFNGVGTVVYGGRRIPDIVGALRVDQGWGSAQIMAAMHQVWTAGTAFDTFVPEGEIGWAVGAGATFNVPFGSGTTVGLTGAYTQGALLYVTDGSTGGLVAAPGVYVSTAADALVDVNGDLELVKAWGISGGFSTNFTPTISLAFQASYLDVSHGTVGDVDLDGIADSGDYSNFDVQGFIGYRPVSGFVLGVGAEYRYVDLDDDSYCNVAVAPGAACPAAEVISTDSPQGLTVFFRAQRDF